MLRAKIPRCRRLAHAANGRVRYRDCLLFSCVCPGRPPRWATFEESSHVESTPVCGPCDRVCGSGWRRRISGHPAKHYSRAGVCAGRGDSAFCGGFCTGRGAGRGDGGCFGAASPARNRKRDCCPLEVQRDGDLEELGAASRTGHAAHAIAPGLRTTRRPRRGGGPPRRRRHIGLPSGPSDVTAAGAATHGREPAGAGKRRAAPCSTSAARADAGSVRAS